MSTSVLAPDTLTTQDTHVDAQSWYASEPTASTIAQTDARTVSKPKRERKPKQAPAPEPVVASVPRLTDKHGYVRYADAQSAARTRNGFVPAKVNYAAQARAHILALLNNAAGRKLVADVALLTDSLTTSGNIPADYVHRPHVLYWRKQALALAEASK